MTIDAQSGARQEFSHRFRDATFTTWLPDSSGILFVADQADEYREHPRKVWLQPGPRGEPHRVTPISSIPERVGKVGRDGIRFGGARRGVYALADSNSRWQSAADCIRALRRTARCCTATRRSHDRQLRRTGKYATCLAGPRRRKPSDPHEGGDESLARRDFGRISGGVRFQSRWSDRHLAHEREWQRGPPAVTSRVRPGCLSHRTDDS